MSEAIEALHRMIYGNWATCVVYVFAELAIADRLRSSAVTVTALAAATGTDASALERFLRCCETMALVTRDVDNGRYSLAPLGELLRSDHPRSQRDAARLNGAPFRYRPWGHLLEILRSGSGEGYSEIWGQSAFTRYADQPERIAMIQGAMTDLSVGDNELLAAAWDFSPYRHVVDLGCGRGTFIRSVLDAHPHLRGTMFDLPIVLEQVTLDGSRGDRLRLEAGDFFSSVPDHGDVYILKNVIHNWPHDKVLTLLGNVRKALAAARQGEERRLLVIEYLITPDPSDAIPRWLDLNHFILLDGRDRTLEEYRDLAAQAGLEIERAIPTPTGRHILELVLEDGGA